MPSPPKGGKCASPGSPWRAWRWRRLQTIGLWGKTGTDFARMVYLDNFSFFFYLIFLLGAALTVLISRQYLEDYGKNLGEYYALILFATVGMMLMAAGAHLIMIFLGLEIMSIAVYVLAGLFREDLRSNEAALKYLILGSFSSAFLLFGMAMLYGASGGTLFLERPAPAPGRRPGHGAPGAPGHRPVDRGLRLQGGFGPLPHVDPGRL